MANREKVIDGLRCHSADKMEQDCSERPYLDEWDCSKSLCADALDVVEGQVPITRCRDCKHGKWTHIYTDVYCTMHDDIHEPDWFCGDGKRRI